MVELWKEKLKILRNEKCFKEEICNEVRHEGRLAMYEMLSVAYLDDL